MFMTSNQKHLHTRDFWVVGLRLRRYGGNGPAMFRVTNAYAAHEIVKTLTGLLKTGELQYIGGVDHTRVQGFWIRPPAPPILYYDSQGNREEV